jgi:hypothetical protein
MAVVARTRVGGRFELVARVGAGSFGEVWRGTDSVTGADVAIKRLHGHLDDPGAVARFLREATALSRVRSDNVVGYVAHGSDEDGRPWLATEWIDGTDFARSRALPRMRRARLVRVMADVARGAAALHAAGLVHRDLKPSNVFVPSDDGPTRVVDLGVAHLVGGTVLTDAGAILGTPSYMAPEQVRGDRIDPRADNWSLGVMLYEVVAGETPFASPHAVAVLGRVLLDPAPPLSSVDPMVPQRLAALVAALLDKDANRRPSDARWIADELDAILAEPGAQDWLESAPRFDPSLDETVTPSSAHVPPRGERRWVAMLAARFVGAAPQPWLLRCESAGARVESVRGATFVGFGLLQARGDELLVAARAALDAQRAGASVALVAGWAEVLGGAVAAGALIDRVAAVLDRTAKAEALLVLDGAERLDEHFELELRADGLAKLLAARGQSDAIDGRSASHRVLGRVVAAVGREKELALLIALVAESIAERNARAALVIGEAGIGKTRLLTELRARLRASGDAPGWLVLRGDPMTSDAPHAMLARGLRASAGVEESGGAEDSVLRWAEEFSGGALRSTEREALLDLVELPVERAREHEDPAHQRQREYEALVMLFRGALSKRPLVIAVEDLHWADRATVDTLGRLFADCADEPLSLLAVARPEVTSRYPTLWRAMARTELRLSPLSDRASDALVNAVIELPVEERRALVRRAGGNPLFLEELVRARAAGLVTLPAAVHTVLQARLDALGPEVRRVAQAASVFGPTFWSEGVAALRGARSTGAALVALERAELVTLHPHSRVAHCTEYAFSHALARDAAYAMIVESEQRALHGRAAEWLASVGQRDPVVLAQHYASAGRTFDASEQLRKAAQQALSECAYGDAVAHCTRALGLTPQGDGAIECLLLRASARDALGQPEEMLADATAARDAPTLDATQAIRARALCAEALFALGELQSADQALRAVLEESHATLVSARVQAVVRLAEVDIASGRASEGDVLIDEALAWLEEAGPGYDVLRLRARRVRASARMSAGDVAGALREAWHALRDAEAIAHRGAIAEGRTALASLLVLAGDAPTARVELERARREVDGVGAPALRAAFECAWAAVVAETETLEATQHACERAAEIARECGRVTYGQIALVRMAMAEVLAGAEVRALFDALPLGALAAPARAVRAAEWLRRENLERASSEAEASLAAMGPRAEVLEGECFVRLVHARVLLAAGRERDADAALFRARERIERKASRLATPEARARYVEGVAARRALKALWLARRVE